MPDQNQGIAKTIAKAVTVKQRAVSKRKLLGIGRFVCIMAVATDAVVQTAWSSLNRVRKPAMNISVNSATAINVLIMRNMITALSIVVRNSIAAIQFLVKAWNIVTSIGFIVNLETVILKLEPKRKHAPTRPFVGFTNIEANLIFANVSMKVA